MLVAALGPIVMLLPWSPRLIAHPGRLLTGTDPTTSLPTSPAPAWQVLLGRGAVDGLPPKWVSVIALGAMVTLTLLALLLGRRRLSSAVVVGVTSAASFCLVLAAWATRVLVTIDGQQVRPSLDLLLLLAGGLVLVMCLAAMRPPAVAATRRRTEHLTTGSLAAAVVAALIGLLGLGTAMGGQSGSPLQVRPNPLPAYVADVQDSTRATRTLVIDISGETHRWMLTSSRTPGWGSGEAFPVLADASQADQVAAIAAHLSTGSPGEDLAERLAALGVAHVVMSGADPATVQGVSNAPGLTAATLEDGSTVWTVQGLVSRAAMVSATGGLTPLPGAQVTDSGTVRLAELPDDRWLVEVDNQQVEVTADPSGFGIRADVSGRTGRLTWQTAPSWAALVAHLVLVGLLVVLAAPTARRPGARPPARSIETPRRSL